MMCEVNECRFLNKNHQNIDRVALLIIRLLARLVNRVFGYV